MTRNLAENIKEIPKKTAKKPAKQPSQARFSNTSPALNTRGRLLTLATNFIAGMGLLAFLGYQLDSYMEANHYVYTLLGLALGFIWGFYEIIKFALRTQNQTASSPAQTSPAQNNVPSKSISHENPPKK